MQFLSINNQTIDYELSIALECIVYQFHCSLAMKMRDLRARQIEHVRSIGCMPARSRAIALVSLKYLYLAALLKDALGLPAPLR